MWVELFNLIPALFTAPGWFFSYLVFTSQWPLHVLAIVAQEEIHSIRAAYILPFRPLKVLREPSDNEKAVTSPLNCIKTFEAFSKKYSKCVLDHSNYIMQLFHLLKSIFLFEQSIHIQRDILR